MPIRVESINKVKIVSYAAIPDQTQNWQDVKYIQLNQLLPDEETF